MILLLACTETKDSTPKDSLHESTPNTSTVAVEEQSTGVITCADPSVRASTPYQRVTDTGWLNQPPADPMYGSPAGGISAGDFNQDGIVDVYLPNPGQDYVFLGDGTGRWAQTSMFTELSLGEAAVPADYNADGFPDVFVGQRGPSVLVANSMGSLSGVTAGVEGGDQYSVGAVWGDVDGNETLDIFVATHFFSAVNPEYIASGVFPAPDPNFLYLQENGTFTNASDRIPSTGINAPTYVGALIDIDGDQDLDLYTVNDFGRMVQPNALFINDGTGHFTEATNTGLEAALCGMGMGIGDINQDGTPDFLLSGWDELKLLMSDGSGGWYDAAQAVGMHATEGDNRHIAWGNDLADLDNDGDLDAFVGYGILPMPEEERAKFEELLGWPNPYEQPDAIYLQGEDGQFTQVAESWGVADITSTHGVLVTDLDGNGWQDILTRPIDGPANIFLAQCGEAHFLSVRLQQPGMNRDAIGARVVVTTEQGTQTRWIHAGGTGLSAGGPPVAHVGLDAATSATVEVFWPDGEYSIHTLDADQNMTLVRAE